MSIINFWTNVTYNVGVSIYRKTKENTGQACNFIKKESLAQVFSCEFCEISKNTFFHRTPLNDCFYDKWMQNLWEITQVFPSIILIFIFCS